MLQQFVHDDSPNSLDGRHRPTLNSRMHLQEFCSLKGVHVRETKAALQAI
jgi:hypothetical protein